MLGIRGVLWRIPSYKRSGGMSAIAELLYKQNVLFCRGYPIADVVVDDIMAS